MNVCKFGGSSLADAGQIRKVCRLVTGDPRRRIVVVSAPGKRDAKDTKVTDLLIAAARAVLAGGTGEAEAAAVTERFATIQHELGLSVDTTVRLDLDLRERLARRDLPSAAFLDLIKAFGEDASARLVAEALTHGGHPAVYVNPGEAGLRMTAEYGNAQLLPESYAALAALAHRRELVVFPGFFGYTPDGEVVTFPRGGSDITGSILAAAVGAEVYENFTDVDSVFAADPRVVANPQPITALTFREMRELAYAGFNVLHEEAILPAIRAGIPIWIRNTNRPEAAGTRILSERSPTECRVVGIASDGGFCTVHMGKYLMNRELGFGRRLFQLLEEEALSYEHAPSGIDNVSVILREAALDVEREARLVGRLEADLGCTDILVERGLALVMIVGEGMRYHVGIAARATGALAAAGVNIEMLNQGASEISMMFGVRGADRERAVRALYTAFFCGPDAAREGRT